MKNDGDGKADVEAPAGERKLVAVALAKTQRRTGDAPRQPPRARKHGAAHVEAGHLTAPAGQRHHVAQNDACSAADLEDPLAGANGHEAQEAPSQPDLRRRSAAHLQSLGELGGGRLRVDRAPDVGMRLSGHRPVSRSSGARSRCYRSTASRRGRGH